MRYRCVDAQKAAGFPVAAACQAAGVTRSAYYAWTTSIAQGPSNHDRQEARLVAEIRRIHARSKATYGAPRVHAELGRRGWRVNHKRVERLMRSHGIVGYRPRRRRGLTKPDQGAAPAPDLLGRLFDPDRVDVAWCGDVTWIPTDEGWLYLASVIDLASRHLLGYSMGAHRPAHQVPEARSMTLARYSQPSSVGIQVTSPHQARSGRSGSNSRPSRSGAGGAARSWRVRLRRQRAGSRRRYGRASAARAACGWSAGRAGAARR